MVMTGPDLTRFVTAQTDTWAAALAQLRAGRKTSHWMWFIFPQIAGLGQSPTARRYAIRDLDEAHAYLLHPELGARLAMAAETVLGWAGRRSAVAIFGNIDAIKLCSSMTLFEVAGRQPVFGRVLEAFHGGERDQATLRLIG